MDVENQSNFEQVFTFDHATLQGHLQLSLAFELKWRSHFKKTALLKVIVEFLVLFLILYIKYAVRV